jgi:hypothetical protein
MPTRLRSCSAQLARSENGDCVGQNDRMAQSADPVDQRRVEELVGNPGERFIELRDRIQNENIKRFRDVESEFLAWLWCVDMYRVEQVTPRVPPSSKKAAGLDEDALAAGMYRGKGDRFSDVLSLLLSNKTASRLAPRGKVQGYSQLHQIDIAWPAPDHGVAEDPIVCCESKITGAPGFGATKARTIREDWTNRRKELKFQATDLKLFQAKDDPRIRNWDQWRRSAKPLVFAIWAGRLTNRTELKYMVDQARDLTDTYLDRVGIFGFITNATEDGYEAASPGRDVAERVTGLDTVLDLIEAEIDSYRDKHPEAGLKPEPF